MSSSQTGPQPLSTQPLPRTQPLQLNASHFKMYDIFKNAVGNTTNVNNINIILANLAVGDTSHDIDKKDKGVLGITSKLNDFTTDEAKMYQEGIPVSYITVPSEEIAIVVPILPVTGIILSCF